MIEQLLADVPPERFLNEHYQKLPFALAGAAQSLLPLGDRELANGLINHSAADLMIVRSGKRWSGDFPDLTDPSQLVQDGWTFVVRHAERLVVQLEELSRGFERDLGGSVDVHYYWTPPAGFGFGWHYDAEEVFVVQVRGSKDYQLRKNTVAPWPVLETLPNDMHYEAELSPLMRCRLTAGDWLYIPSGYWHKAVAVDESISLAIGVLPLTGINVFDFLRREVLQSLRWRQRLPNVGVLQSLGPAKVRELYADVLKTLAKSQKAD